MELFLLIFNDNYGPRLNIRFLKLKLEKLFFHALDYLNRQKPISDHLSTLVTQLHPIVNVEPLKSKKKVEVPLRKKHEHLWYFVLLIKVKFVCLYNTAVINF